MNDCRILFGSNLSIGVLDVLTMDFKRVENVNENHEIFKRIKPPFDWYYHDKIMIIPDIIPTPKEDWDKVVNVCGQEIECVGKFIYFFHFEIIDNGSHATSLTLPEYDHVKNGLGRV